MIGVAITTRNRSLILQQTLAAWKEHLPTGSKLVIVDDASDIPVTNPTFRFETRQGLAKAKNKCLELLEGCTDIFIVDDDIMPVKPNWWSIYVLSGLNHACWTFNRQRRHVAENYVEYVDPNGCMLYFKKICLDTVGGWDIDFKGYGHEHANMSDRIFNAGLTPARYIDVRNSLSVFTMIECASTFSTAERRITIPANKKLYLENFNSKEFKSYK